MHCFRTSTHDLRIVKKRCNYNKTNNPDAYRSYLFFCLQKERAYFLFFVALRFGAAFFAGAFRFAAGRFAALRFGAAFRFAGALRFAGAFRFFAAMVITSFHEKIISYL